MCVCVTCDGREIGSNFLFMFRSMFFTSRIVFAVFSYRLCVSNISSKNTQKNYKAVFVVLIFVISRIILILEVYRDEVKSLEAAVHRSLPEFGCGRTQSKNRSINLCIQRSLCLSLPAISFLFLLLNNIVFMLPLVFIWKN